MAIRVKRPVSLKDCLLIITPTYFQIFRRLCLLHHSCRNYGLDTLVKLAGKNERVLLWIRNISDVLIYLPTNMYKSLPTFDSKTGIPN